MVQAAPPERTWKDPKTTSRPPRHPVRHLTFVWRTMALSTSTCVRCLQAVSHRHVQTAPKNSPTEPAPEKQDFIGPRSPFQI